MCLFIPWPWKVQIPRKTKLRDLQKNSTAWTSSQEDIAISKYINVYIGMGILTHMHAHTHMYSHTCIHRDTHIIFILYLTLT